MPFEQLTLDAYVAERARDAAMGRANDHANDAWKRAVTDAIERAAEQFPSFTTDKVIDLLRGVPVGTHEPRALGPLMKAAERAGIIRATDRFENSTAISRHRAPKRVWQSLIYRQ